MDTKNRIQIRWTESMIRYKKFSGSWAFILHRITGLGLTAYILLHIYTLTSLQQGPEAFNAKMGVFTQPIWVFLAWILFGLVIFHSLNGVRIVLVDFANGARYHKPLYYGAIALGGILFLWMGYIMFFGQETHDIFTSIVNLFR